MLLSYLALFQVYSRFLCYFFVSRSLAFSIGFVTFAQTVTINQEGSHGTNKEVRVRTRPNPL